MLPGLLTVTDSPTLVYGQGLTVVYGLLPTAVTGTYTVFVLTMVDFVSPVLVLVL
jgi:hypothetical protein